MTGADNVYSYVGGDVAQARLDYPIETNNTCALKVSIALNESGINIPFIQSTSGNPGTIQGADGKYYFLNAKALNVWMKKTFGISPSNPQHYKYNSVDGGTDGENFPTLLNGKKGIYSMIPDPQANFGASGHADMFDGNKCAAKCYFNVAQEIDFWVLN
ncbi:T6SS effector amidase Tae4 family protein [Mesonia sp. K7]|uniref:T6SS effector amidase Tae4 family protein n=1 Tax=Mesonia sp. K7 TaxID=2218606 RepID=UPI000DA939B1|nr:T6SS effector amidase Tae4 family protein [Mesonia sp. K7]PZD79018.1 hypothetical protein DNG35_03150 [Mesonia sp. K7]